MNLAIHKLLVLVLKHSSEINVVERKISNPALKTFSSIVNYNVSFAALK